MFICRSSRSGNRRHGYVLLMTVILIALAGVTMLTAARGSLRSAMDASRAASDVQQRWLTLSAQRTILPRAAQWFDHTPAVEDAQGDHVRPVGEPASSQSLTDPHRQMRLQLGDLTVHLVVTDEQAKIHVPSLVSRRGRGEAETLIRRALREVRSSPIAQADVDVALRPYEPPRLEAFKLPAFGSYGQVFADPRPEDLIVLADDHDTATASWESARGPADLVTCWGDGRVNLRRASAAVLEAVCEPLIGPAEINQLLVLRDQHADQPAADLKTMLEQLEVAVPRRAQLAQLLTLRSTCFGLWVVVEDDRRTWRHFAVSASKDPSKTSALGGMMQTFSW